MKTEEWEKWYNKILTDFNFSKDEDEYSAKVLNNILNEFGSTKVENLLDNISSKKAGLDSFVIFGAGPSLKSNIRYLKKYENIENYILIAADGATTALLEENIIPDIIATDLDGKIDDLLLANDLGSFFVVHAHGNNLNEITKYVSKFKKVLGTTQSEPVGKLYNFGGFTDGDRGVFLAIELKAKKILLAGMDFGNIVTNYSRPDMDSELGIADEIKQKKLKYAEILVDWIANNEDVEIIDLNS